MAPGILPPEPTFTVKEMEKTAKEKHDFGAVIDDLNLDNISGKHTGGMTMAMRLANVAL